MLFVAIKLYKIPFFGLINSKFYYADTCLHGIAVPKSTRFSKFRILISGLSIQVVSRKGFIALEVSHLFVPKPNST